MIKLEDLYFGVKMREGNELVTRNLFSFHRVRWSVATYVAMTPERKKNLLSEPVHFCFGDVWGRCEYEYIISDWPYSTADDLEATGQKVDVYQMYVEPNADYLMSLVNSVSRSSAKRYLTEWRKKYGRR